MVHLRIVTPPDRTDEVLGILDCTPSVINIIKLPGAARRPDGDVVVADVAREDASVILEDLTPDDFNTTEDQVADLIASPDIFSAIVALCAGAAGTLSLSTAKSGALIGVLISVTTIPAAANIGVAAAYGDRDGWVGSMEQLGINLAAILVAGTTVLALQRMLDERRRRHHLRDDNPPVPRDTRSASAER